MELVENDSAPAHVLKKAGCKSIKYANGEGNGI